MNKRPLAGIGSLALNGRMWVFALRETACGR
jgi:hypothetical protein